MSPPVSNCIHNTIHMNSCYFQGGIELGGIFVKELTIGGPAALSGQISAGEYTMTDA